MSSIDELFEAVREACPAGTWSKGVELVRRFAVSGVSSTDVEVVCRVKLPERAVPHNVQVYPEDAEWDCDCQSRAPCCEHVAAAVIALRKARADGKDLPEGRSGSGRLVYRLGRIKGELALNRIIVQADGTEIPLKVNLASAVARGTAGAFVHPSQEDLNLDRLLGAGVSGPIQRDRVPQVLKLLSSARNVEFEGKAVHVSTEILRPVARVRDAGDDFEVVLERDPRIEEVVAPGVAVAADTLYQLAAVDIAGPRYEQLPNSKVYGRDQLATLMTQVLPELEKRFTLHVDTARLPELTHDERPRIVVEVEQEGDRLTAMSILVYGDPPIARIDKNRLVHLDGPIPIRDVSLEQRVAEQAKNVLGIGIGNRVFLESNEAVAFAQRLERFKGEVRGSQGRRFIHDEVLSPKVDTTESGGFAVRFEHGGSDGSLSASAEAVAKAWQEGASLVPLLSGGFAQLPSDWLEKHGDTLLALLAARTGEDEFAPYAAPLVIALCESLETPPPPRFEEARRLLSEDAADDLPLPKDLDAELRPYQIRGARWLLRMRRLGLGAVLADDMGLGKTLQTIAAIEGQTLIVAPTSVVFNWASELQRFRPGLSVNNFTGKGRKLDSKAQITLTSYALLRIDIEALGGVDWNMVVLDEAQMIKNPDSQSAQAAYSLKAGFRVSLSGTPVENRLEELWSQLHFTNPGLLGGRSDFAERFETPIRDGQVGAAASLRARIAPFILRREKKTVAKELPPRSDMVLHCELSEDERGLYQALYAATQKEVVERLQEGGNVMQALEALLRLRQAACHPGLLPGKSSATSAKVERLLMALEEARADGHKALVFSQWTSFLDLLEPPLREAGIRFGRLDGSTRDRAGVVGEFQSEDGPEVLLLSLKAGGTGLNLTAADHVFLMDLWWNPAVEEQAADRTHRIGQDKPVFVYRLVSKDTVEERILELQAKKRALSAAALSDADQAGGLSREDLLDLLR